jgi:predicted dienelactone hydrolase
MLKHLIVAAALVGTSTGLAMAENRIDRIRPDAPELARHGELSIGVRTIELTNPDQIDIVNIEAGKPHPRYDRALTVEVWYPANTTATGGAYQGVYLRDGQTQVTLQGKAVRDAEPLADAGRKYPLVVISHGYPGNRFLMSHLAENLATKGYVVASIDHRDSTYNDQTKFGSTLVNRPWDQKFVIDQLASIKDQEGHFLSGMIDGENIGVVGYSMGGYGAVVLAGGGVTKASTEYAWGAPDGTLNVNLAGSDAHKGLSDQRVKAVVAIAPWGMNTGFWDEEGLKGVNKPIFVMAGSLDTTSLYEKGIRKIYELSTNAPERYLLTFENAGHNAAAPIPAPAESWPHSEKLGWAPFGHYADPVWDTERMNNIAQHFTTVFFDRALKNDEGKSTYFELIEKGTEGVFALDEAKNPKAEHTYWRGFQDGAARGLIFEQAKAQ